VGAGQWLWASSLVSPHAEAWSYSHRGGAERQRKSLCRGFWLTPHFSVGAGQWLWVSSLVSPHAEAWSYSHAEGRRGKEKVCAADFG